MARGRQPGDRHSQRGAGLQVEDLLQPLPSRLPMFWPVDKRPLAQQLCQLCSKFIRQACPPFGLAGTRLLHRPAPGQYPQAQSKQGVGSRRQGLPPAAERLRPPEGIGGGELTAKSLGQGLQPGSAADAAAAEIQDHLPFQSQPGGVVEQLFNRELYADTRAAARNVFGQVQPGVGISAAAASPGGAPKL